MLRGRIILELRDCRQPLDDLDLRLSELARTFFDHSFQPDVVSATFEMHRAQVQEIVRPQNDFLSVERLCKKVRRTGGERLFPSWRRDVRGQYNDWEDLLLIPQRLQLIHDLESIRMRHVYVEQDQIGAKFIAE